MRHEQLGHGADLGGKDLERIVLDPARMRVVLLELALRDAHHLAGGIYEHAARRCRALVERYDVFLHGKAFLLMGVCELL